MPGKKSPKRSVKPDINPLEIIRQIGDEVMAAVLKDIAEGKFPAKKKIKEKPVADKIQVVHNDDDLQEEQDTFDAENPPGTRDKALDGLIKAFKRKQAAKNRAKPKGK